MLAPALIVIVVIEWFLLPYPVCRSEPMEPDLIALYRRPPWLKETNEIRDLRCPVQTAWQARFRTARPRPKMPRVYMLFLFSLFDIVFAALFSGERYGRIGRHAEPKHAGLSEALRLVGPRPELPALRAHHNGWRLNRRHGRMARATAVAGQRGWAGQRHVRCGQSRLSTGPRPHHRPPQLRRAVSAGDARLRNAVLRCASERRPVVWRHAYGAAGRVADRVSQDDPPTAPSAVASAALRADGGNVLPAEDHRRGAFLRRELHASRRPRLGPGPRAPRLSAAARAPLLRRFHHHRHQHEPGLAERGARGRTLSPGSSLVDSRPQTRVARGRMDREAARRLLHASDAACLFHIHIEQRNASEQARRGDRFVPLEGLSSQYREYPHLRARLPAERRIRAWRYMELGVEPRCGQPRLGDHTRILPRRNRGLFAQAPASRPQLRLGRTVRALGSVETAFAERHSLALLLVASGGASRGT